MLHKYNMRRSDSKIERKHIIYKLYFSNNFFYIGVTNNLQRRLHEHRWTKKNLQLINWEIIKDNLTEDEAYKQEKEIVTESLIKDPLCLNETRGGRHPYNKRKGRPHTEETKLKISQTIKQKAQLGILWCQQPENREYLSKCFTGRKHTQTAKEKIRQSKLGPLNPSYGKPSALKNHKFTQKQLQKRSYKILTPFGTFNSSVEAGRQLNLSQQGVINRCRNIKFPNWQILAKGDKYTKYKYSKYRLDNDDILPIMS